MLRSSQLQGDAGGIGRGASPLHFHHHLFTSLPLLSPFTACVLTRELPSGVDVDHSALRRFD